MAKLECPFCEYENRITEPEDLPWCEDSEYEKKCFSCDKTFLIIADVRITHYAIDPDDR